MFELAYGETGIFFNALVIAARTYEERLSNPALAMLHDETRIQLSVTRNMMERMMGAAKTAIRADGMYDDDGEL